MSFKIKNHECLLLSDVAVGDKLPELKHEVTTTSVILGALASRDWRPMHHDRDFAQQRNGTRDIFMNTPNQAAWLERFIEDWAGPTARLARYKFRMGDPICPGDEMTFVGEVTSTEQDENDCGWAELKLALMVDNKPKTSFTARVALPVNEDDNPWSRQGDQWTP
jgi:acyl dehydratase